MKLYVGNEMLLILDRYVNFGLANIDDVRN